MNKLGKSYLRAVIKRLPAETKYRLVKKAKAEKKTLEEMIVFLLASGVNTAPF